MPIPPVMPAVTTTVATTDPLAQIIELGRGAKHLASLTLPFEPVPASRPRVSRWGVYYAKTYKTWKKLAEDYLQPGDLPVEQSDPLLVLTLAVVARPKKPTYDFPIPDVDNLAKGPMDVVTHATGYWHDDKQVTWLISGKRFTAPGEEPHTEVHIYRPCV